MAAVESKLADYHQHDLEELKKYKDENESIIDAEMEFIEKPESFWSHASTPVKKIVQQFIVPEVFPMTLEPDMEPTNIESYPLIQKPPRRVIP